MSETTETVVVEETPEAPAPAAAEVENPYEAQASEQGWVPKDAWVKEGKDPEEWRPAKEFVERGELYKTIHNTRRDLKQAQQALTAMQRHQQHLIEKAYQKAINDLKLERRQALRNEDLERVEALDERIEETQEEHAKERDEFAQVAQQTQVAGPHPDFQVWLDRNPWYATDVELQEFADAAGIVYAKKNPTADPRMALKHVEDQVKRRFPEKFGTKRSAPNPTVAPNKTSRTSTSKGDDDYQLDETERAIMNDLVRSKVMTKAEYIAELKKVKGG